MSDFYSQGVLYRACSRCGKAYPLDHQHFDRDPKGKDGLRFVCKPCCRARSRAYYLRTLGYKEPRSLKVERRIEEFREKLKSPLAVRLWRRLQLEAGGESAAVVLPDLQKRAAS